jgi:hypothetical protein
MKFFTIIFLAALLFSGIYLIAEEARLSVHSAMSLRCPKIKVDARGVMDAYQQITKLYSEYNNIMISLNVEFMPQNPRALVYLEPKARESGERIVFEADNLTLSEALTEAAVLAGWLFDYRTESLTFKPIEKFTDNRKVRIFAITNKLIDRLSIERNGDADKIKLALEKKGFQLEIVNVDWLRNSLVVKGYEKDIFKLEASVAISEF